MGRVMGMVGLVQPRRLQKGLCQFLFELCWQFDLVYKGTSAYRPSQRFVNWYERW